MFRVRAVSDLHFEFQRDHGAILSAEVAKNPDYDVLVVAGDLTSYRGIYEALGTLAKAAVGKPVVYVLGNHEAYGATWEAALGEARRARSAFENVYVLERDVAVIGGRRFVGCTLWFPHSPYPEREDQWLGDFAHIRDVYDFLPATAKASAEFLGENVRRGDIVVTHHLPHPHSVHPRYESSPLNRFFLHNVSGIVEQGGAALWVHGHTHCSMDYLASGGTRVLCNPFGYAGYEENADFDGGLTVDLP